MKPDTYTKALNKVRKGGARLACFGEDDFLDVCDGPDGLVVNDGYSCHRIKGFINEAGRVHAIKICNDSDIETLQSLIDFKRHGVRFERGVYAEAFARARAAAIADLQRQIAEIEAVEP